MRKLFCILILLCLSIGGMSQGIVFRDLCFDDALSQAKLENKYVFVDCYTKWCAPCKILATKIFPQKECGDYFNSRFVSIKLDMETKDGRFLGEKYNVAAYPSLLILSPDGKLMGKIVGAVDVNSLITKVSKSIQPQYNFALLSDSFESGKMSKKDLLNYMLLLDDAYETELSQKVRSHLCSLMTSEDSLKCDFWPLLTTGNDIQYVKQNVNVLRENVGYNKVNAYIASCFESEILDGLDYASDNPKRWLKKNSSNKIREEYSNFGLNESVYLDAECNILKAIEKSNLSYVLSAMLKAKSVLPRYSKVNILSCLKNLAYSEGKNMNAYQALYSFATSYTSDVKDPSILADMQLPLSESMRITYPGVWFTRDAQSLDDAIQRASISKQYLLIELYDKSSSESRFMNENILTQYSVGEYINFHYLCYQFECSTPEGKILSEKFSIKSYPSFLILKHDGTFMYSIVSKKTVSDLLESLKAIEPKN